MIKRILLMALLLTSSGLLLAAKTDSLGTRRGMRDPLYLQLYGGINKSANEHLPGSEFSRYPWSGGAFVGLGREVTPLWGWRLAFRYNHNKSRSTEVCESDETWGWNNLGLFADATFDLADAFRPKNALEKRFDIKVFAGIGGVYAFHYRQDIPLSYSAPYNTERKSLSAFRGGLMASYQIKPMWRIGVELSQTMFMDRFNGVKAGCVLDGRTNLKIGFTYFLEKPERILAHKPVAYDTRLREAPALPLLMPAPEEVKVRRIVGRSFLDFPANETVIYPKYRRNPEELRRIMALVDSALFDQSIQVTHISLHGYASPESPYRNNERLSKGRMIALRDFLQQKYGFETALFALENTPEDWTNLRSFIADGNRRKVKDDIWYANADVEETPVMPKQVLRYRKELLEVIDQDIDWDEKESLLRKIGKGEPYKWLLRYVFPGLRHTDYVIEYVIRHYPVEDGCRLIYTHPEALSIREMYAVAQSYPKGSDGWLDALLIAAKQYPEDELANYNAACACVKAKRLNDAQKYLMKAGQHERVRYLQAIINKMKRG